MKKLKDYLFQKHTPYLIFLFLLSLLWRFVYFFEIKNDLLFKSLLFDAKYYNDWAQLLLHRGLLGKGIYFVSPLYAYFLAFLYGLGFGPESVKIIQLALDSFIPLLVYGIGLKAFNRKTALLSGLLAAVYGPSIFFAGFLLKAQLEYLLASLFLFFFLISQEKNKGSFWFFTGAILGIFTLAKDTGLILIVPLAVWIYKISAKSLNPKKGVFLFLIGIIATLAPLTLRNIFVGRDLVLTTWGAGVNFYYGNCLNCDGGLKGPDFMRIEPELEEQDAINEARRLSGKPLKPSQISRFWFNMAVKENIRDPGRFLLHILKKLGLLFNRIGISDNYQMVYFRDRSLVLKRLSLDFWPVAIFGLCGFFLSLIFRLPKEKSMVLWIFFFGQTIILSLGHIIDRYRQPLIPSLIPMACFFVFFIWESFWAKRWKEVFISILLIFLFSFLTSLHFPNFDQKPYADAYNQLGQLYEQNNDLSLAKEAYLKALKVRPEHLWARQSLAEVYVKMGNIESAIEEYKKAILYRPDILQLYVFLDWAVSLRNKDESKIKEALINKEEMSKKLKQMELPEEANLAFRRGMWLMQNKKIKEAIEHFEAVLSFNPIFPNALINLGVLYRANKEPQKSIACYEKLLKEFPGILPARYNLAMVLMSGGNFKEAIPHLEKIVQVFPEYARAQLYLGVAYQNLGEKQKAIQQYEQIIQRLGNSPQEKLTKEQLQEKIWFIEKGNKNNFGQSKHDNIILEKRGFEP